MKYKVEDIAFWTFLLAAFAIVLWILHGSPTLEDALLTLTALIIGSEFMLWRKYYEVDKNAAVAFSHVRNDINNLKKEMERHYKELNQSIHRIETLLHQK